MAEMSHPEASAEGFTQANTPADGRPVYEVGFHLVPSLEESEAQSLAQKIRAHITDNNAEVIAEGASEKVTLAYTIERATTGKREKYNQAYFGWIKFAIEREYIPALEKFMRAAPEVIRFLLIQTVRENVNIAPRRAVFSSDRLEGETIKKPVAAPEMPSEISEEDLDKSIDALVSKSLCISIK